LLKVDIKPLSVNQCWKGRRFKTDEYKSYEKALLLLLPKADIPEGNLSVFLEFGFSNKCSDIDNPVKAFVDILQKRYGFNDSKVYKLEVIKVIVEKKQEYIKFKIQGISC